jgi:hypothetical protein
MCRGLSIKNYMPIRTMKHQFYCKILLPQYHSSEHSHPKSARRKLIPILVENSSCMYGRVFSGLTALTAALRIYVGTHNMHTTTGTNTQIDFPTLCKRSMISTLKHALAAWLWSVAMLRNDFSTTYTACEQANTSSARDKPHCLLQHSSVV